MRNPDPRKASAIFDATLSLVLREGFTALRMSEVAKLAGVATGTLYTYFDDKDDLVRQLYAELLQRNADTILKSFDAAAPFMIAFENLWTSYANAALKTPETAAFFEQFYRSPYWTADMREANSTFLQPVSELLERGQRERLVKDMPTNLLLIQIVGAITELARWHHAGRIKAAPATLRKAFDLAWDSIKR